MAKHLLHPFFKKRIVGRLSIILVSILFLNFCSLGFLWAKEGFAASPFPSITTPKDSFVTGLASYREGRFEDALADFQVSLKDSTGWEEYPRFYLILSHLKMERSAEVLGLCKVFRRDFPKSPLLDRITYIEAQAYQQSSAYWLASRSYKSLLEKREQAEIRLKYGEVLEDMDLISQAYENYKKIRQKWPRSAEARTAKKRAIDIVERHPRWMKRRSEISYMLEEAALCLRQRAYSDALDLYESLFAMPLSETIHRKVLRGQIKGLIGANKLVAAHEVLLALMEHYPSSKEAAQGLLYVGRVYWRKDLNQQALPVLSHLFERYHDTPEAVRASYIMGRVYLENGAMEKAIHHFRETRILYPASSWSTKAAWGEAWCYYLKDDFEACAAHLERGLAKRLWTSEVSCILYWQARSLEKAGRLDQSAELYHKIQEEHSESFYCLLAEWRLSGKSLPNVISPQSGKVFEIKNSPLINGPFPAFPDPVVSLLMEIGLLDEAKERLDKLRRHSRRHSNGEKLTDEAWAAAYSAAGAYYKAMQIAWKSRPLYQLLSQKYSQENDVKKSRLLRFLYPLPYWDLIKKYAMENGLDPFLVAGLMRQESMFRPKIVSPAGAIGLMQIMPATGKRVAKQIGMNDFEVGLLENPEVNIMLGTAYLADLVKRYGEDWIKVFAVYNAGPEAVAKWTASMPQAETDEFVECILYRETRLYVKKVLFNWALYHKIYSVPPRNLDASCEILDSEKIVVDTIARQREP